MGKAIIKQNNGNGWYFVDVEFDNTFGAKEHEKLTLENIAFQNSLASKNITKNTLLSVYDQLLLELNNAVASKDYKKQAETSDVLADLSKEIDSINYQIATTQTQINHNNFKLQILEPDPVYFQSLPAWSADLSEAIPLETIVGIIDPKRTNQKLNDVVIKPTFRNGATDGYLYSSVDDGVMVKKFGQPSAGWAWNLAMSDGADTWISRYIYGNISTINHGSNSCTFTIDHLSIAPNNHWFGTATFEYMDCDSLAFSEGDSVVVDVGTELNYVVIGFQSVPNTCSTLAITENIRLYNSFFSDHRFMERITLLEK